MPIETVLSFMVPCFLCSREISVGPTAKHKEVPDVTFYFDPLCEAPDASRIVAMSLGDGASVICGGCFNQHKVAPSEVADLIRRLKEESDPTPEAPAESP